jgi:hypothetical protein
MLTQKLEAAQKRLRDKNAGLPSAEAMPILFSGQIQSAVLKTLESIEGLHPFIETALASALPLAIQSMSETLTSESSTSDQRAHASDSLFWLFSVCTKFQTGLAKSAARTAEAQAKKAKSIAEKEGIVIKIAKERKRIQRVLDKVTREGVTNAKPETV